ncbi:thioesterase II family protein [Planomonospora sp. ID82291]|uniref:thioesterase II family protein n=1 Tax=Planomonospora sp. ID82291 TaxID=2738136 RepID=UPI0018C37419|nr:thioesterase [Planomonospora sp. ID82291]MBG0816348.1 thioesterase [Planomonospora sp. ID82291]
MANRPKRRNPWLPHEPSATATGRIFLIPYSGCGASMYRQWPRRRAGVEFLPVELPGHETRFAEPNFETYQELAKSMVIGLGDHLDVPFGFFGHCGSALAAYEVSAELIRSGMPAPARVYVSSEVAPQDGPAGRFLSMDDAELGAELAKLITQLGGKPGAELIELYLEVLRADVETNKRYVMPEPYRLSCPITVIGWTEDDEIPFSTMGGWGECGETTSVLLDGRHHRFIEAPEDLLDVMCSGLGTA